MSPKGDACWYITIPFPYRGYYYDSESGLYYLNSRYYNAEWGRFLNLDSGIYSVGGSVNGYNLFVYCDNNPIIYYDPNGNFSMSSFMLTLHSITYVAGEAIKTAKNDAESKAFVENAKTSLQSIYTTLLDDSLSPIITSMVPKSSLSSAFALRTLGYISESMGVVSGVTAIFQIVWDYEIYNDDLGSFALAAGITVLSTAISVGLSAVIVATEVATGPALAIALTGGLVIGFVENEIRKWLLE